MVLPLLTAVAVVVLLVAEARGAQALRSVAKVTASLAFVATWWVGQGTSPWSIWIGGGLMLGAVGDVCLLSDDRRWFVLGIGAFLLNHVAFCGAFVVKGVHLPSVALAALPLGVFAAWVWSYLRPTVGRLAPAVMAYIVVITTMVALAVGSGSGVWIGAATLFFVSDLCVARQRFVIRSFRNKAIGLPLYFAAQLIFALEGV